MKKARANLLHIDDDLDFLKLFSISFKKEFEIISASDFSEAVEYLKNNIFDIVVLDYDMPEKNGLEVLSLIRDQYPSLPVIFFTGQGNEKVAREAFVAGASDYFNKDFTVFSTREKFINSIIRLVDKRNTEIELEKSRAKYQLLFESMLNGFIVGKVIMDNDGKPDDLLLLEVNQAFADMVGRQRSDFYGKTYCEALSGIKDYVGDLIALIDKVVKTGEPATVERFSPFFGKWYFLNVYRPMEGHFAAVFNDITDLKKAREELEKEKLKSGAIFDNSESVIIIVDKNAKILLVNKKACEILGYQEHEILGHDIFEICIEKNKQDLLRTRFLSFFDNETVDFGEFSEFECHVNTAKGLKRRIKWANNVLRSKDGSSLGLIITGVDVTKLNSIEIELQEKEDILNRVMDTSPVGIVIFDEHQKIRFANKRTEQILDLKKEELIGRTYESLDFACVDDNGVVVECNQSPAEIIFRTGKPVYNMLFSSEGKRGRSFFLVNAAPAANSRGVRNRIILVIKDITEHYMAKKAAMNSELRYRTIFENTGTALVIFNGDGILNLVNREFLKLTGFDHSEVVGIKKWTEFLDTKDKYRILRQFKSTSSNGGEDPRKFEFRLKDKNSATRHVVAYLSNIPSSKGRVVSILDITALKQVEDELIRKNKELNDFAYTVSHDLKNPLNLIRGYLALMAEDPKLFNEYYKKITNQAENLVEFVNKLLELSRAGKIVANMGNINLDYLVRGVFASLTSRDPEAELVLHSAPYLVKGDLMNLARLFSNLMSNAFQHKDPDKERLVIEVNCIQENGGAVISVKDNGIGIDRTNLEKIFLPGFTSGGHLGTGFGLTIAKKIAEAHGGTIAVKSDGQGKGTEFVIKLPL
ncbi:MAG: PAS domain S-box protein [Firmicutes bacterium]|nr:PAS domain S-box protein [Bacillota bacterium]